MDSDKSYQENYGHFEDKYYIQFFITKNKKSRAQLIYKMNVTSTDFFALDFY